MAELKWISEQWMKQQKSKLNGTRKEKAVRAQDENGNWYETGETVPNPHYEDLQKTIEAAEYHLAAKQKIQEAAEKAGYRPSRYDGTCKVTGERVPAGGGFVKKEGKWVTYSREAVIDLLGVTIVDLPEIPE